MFEHRPVEHGDVRDTSADIQRAREELAYEPRTSLEDGIQAQLEWTLETNEGLVGAY